ncbi:MAG: peptidylprolyl isomerase [Deltaproteobacteria bacterium]|nr:peptidylprolyl isomerase [Deltaproteobacteria bacterium]MBN2846557.1 peptidylprolyl isomerase [Deltaproteobacteria bacterium]
MKHVTISIIAFIVLLFFVISTHAFEDRIVAVVNNEAITLSELDEAVEAFLNVVTRSQPSVKREDIIEEARKASLNKLIDGVLLKQEASRLKIVISDQEISRTMNDMLVRRNISFDEFSESLKKEGMTLDDYKKEISQYLLTRKIVEKTIRYKIAVSDEEIGDYYGNHRNQYEGKEANRVQQILIVKPKGADQETVSALREKAETILKRLIEGEPFEALAVQYSQGPAAQAGGDLGFLEKGMMYPEVDEEVFRLKKGEMGGVVESPIGFHIIKVLDKRGAGVKPIEEVREEIIGRISEEKIEEKFQEWFKKLREKSHIDIRL